MDPCRICLKQKPSNFLTNIQSATFQYVSYRHIYSYFGTVLEDHKEFPLLICRDCEFQMICAYKFKMKCLEAEIKISLILQSKLQMDKPTVDDESNRLDCLIELNTLTQQQEMEINLISSFINAPEVLSIENDDMTKGEVNFASNTSGLIDFNDQFDYDTQVCSESKFYSTEILPDLFGTVLMDSTCSELIKCDQSNIYPMCRILHNNAAGVLQENQEQTDDGSMCKKCGEKLIDNNSSNKDEMLCNQCVNDNNSLQQSSFESYTIFPNKNQESSRKNSELADISNEINLEDKNKIANELNNRKKHKRTKKSRKSAKKVDDSYEECKICGIYIKSINICRHLELHQNKAANKKYPCYICGKTFAVKYYANDHVKRVHKRMENDVNSSEILPKMKVKCNICDKEVRKYFLDRHMKSHRSKNVDNQSFICDLCQKSFISRETIRAHMITVHLKKKRYNCNHCDQKFIHSLTRYRHINRYHLKKTVASCSLCSASFYHKTSLVAHRRKFHPPSITLKCDECNAIYFDRRQLKKHLLVHFKNNMRTLW